MAIQLTRRRFTVDEYHRMAHAGVLSEDERVELIEGEIIDMTPIGVRHARCVDQLNLLLTGSLSKRARVRVQSPVRLNELNEPQPDVTLLKMRDYSQDHDHPGPQDILLLIEVSDSTLDYDRTEKLPLFARSWHPRVLGGQSEGRCRRGLWQPGRRQIFYKPPSRPGGQPGDLRLSWPYHLGIRTPQIATLSRGWRRARSVKPGGLGRKQALRACFLPQDLL